MVHFRKELQSHPNGPQILFIEYIFISLKILCEHSRPFTASRNVLLGFSVRAVRPEKAVTGMLRIGKFIPKRMRLDSCKLDKKALHYREASFGGSCGVEDACVGIPLQPHYSYHPNAPNISRTYVVDLIRRCRRYSGLVSKGWNLHPAHGEPHFCYMLSRSQFVARRVMAAFEV